MKVKTRILGTAAVTGATVLSLVVSATPAHAALYATGKFHNSQSASLCIETYAISGAGTANCSVSLAIGTFSLVVNHGDGTCSGSAPATLTVNSPSTPTAPKAIGPLTVTHGVGSFIGNGTDGLIVTLATAKLTGSRCRPENVLGSVQTLSGTYELHA